MDKMSKIMGIAAVLMVAACAVGIVWTDEGSSADDTQYTITIAAGTGGGAIGYIYVTIGSGTPTPAYFNSPGTFNAGTTVGMTATAHSGYEFVNWTDSNGDIVSTANPYEITLSASETYTANFTVGSYTVTYAAGTGGSATGYIYVGTTQGYFNSPGTYTGGTTVGLSATPDTGYEFVNWTDSNGDEVSTANPYEFTLSASETYTANFTTQSYTINVTSGTGGSAIGYYYIGSLKGYFNTASMRYGATIGLQAGTDTGYVFVNWTDSNGDEVSTANPYEFTVTGAETYTANFRQDYYVYTLTFNANGGSGAPATMTGTGDGLTYSFTIPDTVPTRSHYTFLGWSTAASATSSTYAVGTTLSVWAGQTVTLYAVWQEESAVSLSLDNIIKTIGQNFFGGSSTVAGLAIIVVAWLVCVAILANIGASPVFSVVPMIPIILIFAAYNIVSTEVSILIILMCAILSATTVRGLIKG